ncbi:MAG: ferrous iron transport protein B [Candidatus Lernaella stagnicola]|nr:ferrous iron transport protein B [Candidatus Lernaella stagnicola]
MSESNGDRRVLRVVLAGNPNSGKTSIFNALTGSNQRVGNYPGITIEKKEGHFQDGGWDFRVLDLPGTYSLTAYSPEERIARREILRDDLDVVVVVADSTNLDRNLYLLLQVMELGGNAVLVLNMTDEAEAGGQRLDVPQMRALLGIPVVQTVGNRGRGVDELKQAVFKAVEQPTRGERLVYGEDFETPLARLADRIMPHLPREAPPSRWLAIKVIECDPEIERQLRDWTVADEGLLEEIKAQAAALAAEHQTDGPLFVADRRYSFIAGLLREVRVAEMRRDSRRASDSVDEVLVHRVLGIPIFFTMMYLLFWATFSVGEIPMHWIEAGFEMLTAAINSMWAPGQESVLRSLIVDGIIGGVGGVLVFLPNILILFFGLSLLEDTGYMSRAAFLMDRFMHRMGLHGKSFVPMLTGFGCSIPGIMACRTLDNERDRLTTMLVLPLMSCGARLPIYLLMVPAFFAAKWQAPMLWLLYFIGIGLAVVLAKLLRVTILAGDDAPFVMELPPYRLPTLKAITLKMWQRGWLYVRKAGTVILAISILLWLATAYPKVGPLENATPQQQAQAALEYSAAGHVGRLLEPVTSTMGADFRITTAMIGAFAAKEIFVAQMGIVFSLGESDETNESLREVLSRTYTPLQAFCVMLFLLIATPCMATVAVTRRESGSWKWAALQFWGLTFVGWLLATVVYQIGRMVL